jgi:hypothetical protein
MAVLADVDERTIVKIIDGVVYERPRPERERAERILRSHGIIG